MKGLISRFRPQFLFRQMTRPLLVAFDFDHTIVDDNSDIVVRKLIPKDRISDEIKKLYSSDGWTAYMQQIFHLLHTDGITPAQIRDIIIQMPATPGMDVLLRYLKENGADSIIISDSNSVFINDWLASFQLQDTVSRVFTNPAHFDQTGLLNLQMYHFQDWCALSSKNLCKGHILESYLAECKEQGISYSKVAYVGDGKNDLCPCLRLSDKDLAFPREGFILAKKMQLLKEEQDSSMKAQVHEWKTGHDILNVVSNFLTQNPEKL
ncbi:putative phosphatase phospho1 [Blattella germanica]|nr:putative phosphatase phospho1 [Blattella germanica]